VFKLALSRELRRKSRVSPFFSPSPVLAQQDSRRKSNTSPVLSKASTYIQYPDCRICSIYLFIYPIYLFIYLSIIYLSIYLSTYLIYLSTYLSNLSISSSGIEYLRSYQSKNEPTAGGYAGAKRKERTTGRPNKSQVFFNAERFLSQAPRPAKPTARKSEKPLQPRPTTRSTTETISLIICRVPMCGKFLHISGSSNWGAGGRGLTPSGK
jgi:hypothetical protein